MKLRGKPDLTIFQRMPRPLFGDIISSADLKGVSKKAQKISSQTTYDSNVNADIDFGVEDWNEDIDSLFEEFDLDLDDLDF